MSRAERTAVPSHEISRLNIVLPNADAGRSLTCQYTSAANDRRQWNDNTSEDVSRELTERSQVK